MFLPIIPFSPWANTTDLALTQKSMDVIQNPLDFSWSLDFIFGHINN